MVRGGVALFTVALILGCGGGGGGGGFGGSAVGPYATSMSEYHASENPGIPCPTFGVGDEVTVGDFSYRIDKTELYTPENRLPWIANSTERKDFSKDGIKALVVQYSVKNNTPVKKKLDVWMGVTTTDGEKAWWQPYNQNLYVDTHEGFADLPSLLPPGQWQQTVGVMSASGDFVDGAVGRVYYETEEYDPTDPRGRRKIDVLHEQAIVDFGTAEKKGHINPDADSAPPASSGGGGRPKKPPPKKPR